MAKTRNQRVKEAIRFVAEFKPIEINELVTFDHLNTLADEVKRLKKELKETNKAVERQKFSEVA